MSQPPHIAVVGSGLSALGCVQALLGRGAAVTVIDVGETLPPERAAAAEALKWRPAAEWDPRLAAMLRENPTVRGGGIPRKLVFGSDYVYGHGRPFFPTGGEAAAVSFSFARGGFTNAWGGAMLPADDGDTADWPVGREQLAPYYRQALAVLPLSAVHDAVEGAFPLYREPDPRVPLAPPVERLLARFAARAGELGSAGILAGSARLAVRSRQAAEGPGCDGCGLCLTGCPRGAIFNAAPAFERLAAEGRLRYLPGRLAQAFAEGDGQVALTLLDVAGGGRETLSFSRVFVAAGAVSSARLVMASLGVVGRPLAMRESQKFLLPLLWPGGGAGLVSEPGFTLPNALLVVRSPSGRWSQVQVSRMNDLALARLRFAALPAPVRALLAPLLGRLAFGWGSMHSDVSAGFELELDHAGRLSVRCRPNPEFPHAVKAVVGRLWANARQLGLLPLSLLNQLSPPGGGNHYGGIFPMRAQPAAAFDSDLLGRPAGLARLHVVDAAVLPSIPGTTLALPAMANAWRIGAETPLHD